MTTDQSNAVNSVNAQTVGAASRDGEAWHSIDWDKAHRNVRRLQARIVQATQQGRWGKVKALQHLLTHSQSGKVLAVRRVTENDGKKTPGVDGVIWDTPTKKMAAVKQLRQRGYKPRPLRRIYIPKSNGKKRPLSIPTMRDRAMQALYLSALDPVAETISDPNSYGFRKERSCADAIGQCFNALSGTMAPQWILEGDIKSCFDHISHEWMLANVPMNKVMLRKWLNAGYLEKHVLHPTEAGTPQGGICSPVLANLALDGLEKRLLESFPQSCYRGRQHKVHLVRYADDFVITGRSKELLENEVRPIVEEFLKERGLTLSPDKTAITHIKDGFDFLGQNVRKYNGKLVIKPAKANQADFLAKVRQVVKANPTMKAGNLIRRLNPIIRGWANYHRHVVSSRTFTEIDHAIFQCLWRWAKRRHPQKSARWVREKYFGTQGGDNWRFCGTAYEADGTSRTIFLYAAASTRIKRHVKIRRDANPYDPQWELYFESRLGVKMMDNLRHRRQLRSLWMRQNGICPGCGQKITKITGWHNHHVIQRVYGGSDNADNRVLYHPECHRKLHCQASHCRKLSAANPRLERGVGKA